MTSDAPLGFSTGGPGALAKKVGPVVLCFEISATYGGLLAGTRQYHSEQLRLELAAEYPTGGANSGFALVFPEEDLLPVWQCRAHLDSKETFQEGDMGSSLIISWFVDDIDRPIQELIANVLAQVDWRSRARSYDVGEL